MRQGQNSKRPRGRGSNRRNTPARHQTFDSNGPSVRIRGSAYQVHEKYLALARDASASGDRIAAENYLQHAEHYFRIINIDGDGNGKARGQANGSGGRGERGERKQGNGLDNSGQKQAAPELIDGDSEQPVIEMEQPEVAVTPSAGETAAAEEEPEADKPSGD